MMLLTAIGFFGILALMVTMTYWLHLRISKMESTFNTLIWNTSVSCANATKEDGGGGCEDDYCSPASHGLVEEEEEDAITVDEELPHEDDRMSVPAELLTQTVVEVAPAAPQEEKAPETEDAEAGVGWTTKDPAAMTIADLRAALDSVGVRWTKKHKRADLQALWARERGEEVVA